MPKQLKYRKGKWVRPSKMKKLEKKVNNLMKSNETKYQDQVVPPVNVVYNAARVTTMLATPQSLTVNGRVGGSISPFRVKMQGLITAVSASVTPTLCRVLLIQAKEGFIPASHLTSDTQGVWTRAGTVDAPYSPFNDENRKHFVVLHDKSYLVDPDTKAAVKFSINKKISRETTYTGTGVTTERGQIYLVLTSNVTANGPLFQGVSRISYKD